MTPACDRSGWMGTLGGIDVHRLSGDFIGDGEGKGCGIREGYFFSLLSALDSPTGCQNPGTSFLLLPTPLGRLCPPGA